MPSDSLFSRSNQESGGSEDPAEGVRIIGAGEAAEVVERGEAVKRKPSDEPRYGDRPPPPAPDVTPALRFPLSDAGDPAAIPRPKVAPVERRTADDHPPAEDEPILSVEPATGETELPHWTDPPTGEVPRVIVGEQPDADEDQRWASFAAGTSGPRWRDEHPDRDDADLTSTFGEDSGFGDDEPLGALDTSERISHQEFITFEDLQVPESDVGRAQPDRAESEDGPPPPVPSGPTEPIRISSGQPRPAAPTTPAAPPRRQQRPPAEEGDTEPAGTGGGRDVPQAVFVGVAIAVVALILFRIGPPATLLLIEVVVVAAGIELFSALRRGGYRPATLLGLAAVVAYPLAVYWRGADAMPLVLVLTFLFTMLWFILGVGGTAKPVPNIGATLLGAVYVGLLGSFGALIIDIPAEGISLLLLAVIGAVVYDVAGFFGGRRFGRTPLTAVSPNKTMEGLLAGIVGSVLATVVVSFVVGPFSVGQAFVFAVFVAVAAPFGDLAESLLKRDLGLKDMGTLLPGHGGVLDRFDGLLFVLPVAYYAMRLLDVVPGA